MSGKLSFVDLAGSERVKKSGATGETLKVRRCKLTLSNPSRTRLELSA